MQRVCRSFAGLRWEWGARTLHEAGDDVEREGEEQGEGGEVGRGAEGDRRARGRRGRARRERGRGRRGEVREHEELKLGREGGEGECAGGAGVGRRGVGEVLGAWWEARARWL